MISNLKLPKINPKLIIKNTVNHPPIARYYTIKFIFHCPLFNLISCNFSPKSEPIVFFPCIPSWNFILSQLIASIGRWLFLLAYVNRSSIFVDWLSTLTLKSFPPGYLILNTIILRYFYCFYCYWLYSRSFCIYMK